MPDIPGLFTQAKRLDQVTPMVRDAAKTLGAGDVEEPVEVALLPEAIYPHPFEGAPYAVVAGRE